MQRKAPLPPSVSIKKSASVMSIIEFTNSPYLKFQSYPNDIVPIMVLSNASNLEVRDTIRRTWGFYRPYRSNTLRIKIFFMIGTDDFMTQRIIMEQNIFDDVIQVTIPDIYTFIAYKELSAMMWVRTYLPKVPYYIKTEDGVIINMQLFVDQFLPKIETASDQELIIGWFGSEHSIQRDTYQKFIDIVLPTSSGELQYAMNLLYAVTTSAADRMIKTLSHVEFIEYPGDPFVTGILRDAARVNITNLAIISDSLKYEITTSGGCKASFKAKPDLLICTIPLHLGAIKFAYECFDAWNVLIGKKLS